MVFFKTDRFLEGLVLINVLLTSELLHSLIFKSTSSDVTFELTQANFLTWGYKKLFLGNARHSLIQSTICTLRLVPETHKARKEFHLVEAHLEVKLLSFLISQGKVLWGGEQQLKKKHSCQKIR